MILSTLRELVRERTSDVLKSKQKDETVPSFDLAVPPSKVPGDLAANVVLMIAKQVGQAPRQLAEEP
jgi:arginyl-tRNA synthetase